MSGASDTSSAVTRQKSIGTGELAAGGGSGGVLVYAITAFIADQKLQALLIYLVPAVSVFLASVYLMATNKLISWWESYEAERNRKKLLQRAQTGLAEAKQQLKTIEDDPHATTQHKKQARERVQAFERAVLELHAKGVVVIEPST